MNPTISVILFKWKMAKYLQKTRIAKIKLKTKTATFITGRTPVNVVTCQGEMEGKICITNTEKISWAALLILDKADLKASHLLER